MKNFITIFKFTYIQNLKRKGFLITTFIAMILMIVIFNINNITEKFNDSGEKNIVIFNDSNALKINNDDFDILNNSKYKFQVATDKSDIELIKENINKEKNNYYGILEIKEEQNKILTSFYVKTLNDSEIINKINSFINSTLFHEKALSLNLSQDKYEYLLEEVPLDIIQSQEIPEEKYMLVYALILTLYSVIMFYGSVVANSVIEEKSNRIMETLITMSKPLELFTGKVLAICALGITQISIFIAWGGALYKFLKVDSDMFISLKLTGSSIIIFIVCFLMGYLIYSLIYGALGSLVSNSQDSTAALMPMTLLLIIIFMLALNCFESIDGTFAKVLSYIPLSSPIVMFERVMISNVSPIELIISGGISLVTILIIGYISSNIYRRGILHYGKRLSILKALKR